MKGYKLTDRNGRTHSDTQWGEGVTHSALGTNPNLCSNGWIHFYVNPLIAIFMNPVHAHFVSPLLWECLTEGEEMHESTKSGCKKLTTVKQIPVPNVTITQHVAFGILCAKKVHREPSWNTWADNWLNNLDRGKEAAVNAAVNAAYAAYAAYAAAYAAHAAMYATMYATTAAVNAAADAADAANDALTSDEIVEIAEKAITIT